MSRRISDDVADGVAQVGTSGAPCEHVVGEAGEREARGECVGGDDARAGQREESLHGTRCVTTGPRLVAVPKQGRHMQVYPRCAIFFYITSNNCLG